MNLQEKPLENLVSDGGFCAIFRHIGCIGDSLASGELESLKDGVKGYHDYYEHSWGQYLARMCGSTAYNFSTGGLTAKAFLERIDEDRFNIFDPAKKCEAYIVALGCNDARMVMEGQLEFGSIDDVHPEDPDANAETFAGYMGRILSDIRKIEPKARIFLVTMPYMEPDERQALRDRHAALMHEMTLKFNYTYVIDLRKYGPEYDGEFKIRYYLGGHLNTMGYLLTAKMIASYIDYIIRHNPEDFAQAGFIGRGDDLHNESRKW